MFGVITKSANDAAVVIAEGLAGSEPAFGVEMTVTAHRLGMKHTNFANASGLPNPEQISTARDMATLGLALIRDFPTYYAWFNTRSYNFKGQELTNHNHMLGAYDGLDGIKTGFIHAAGFNLVASAKRNGHRLVGAVFGGPSAGGRDRMMAQLLDAGFDNRPMPLDIQMADLAPNAHYTLAQNNAQNSTQAVLENLKLRQPIGEGDAEDPAPVKPVALKKPATAKPVVTIAAKPVITIGGKPTHLQVAAKSEPPSGWAVQVGAFKADAQARNAARAAINGAHADLKHGQVVVLKGGKGSKKMHRARITGLTEHQAHDACRLLGHRGTDCVAIGPDFQA
jgi:D-alanyl-D-alanine carboxypeptidase